MENRVVHLEAALMRSELDLCRAKAELTATRQDAQDLRALQAYEGAGDGPPSGDTPALYHALEGSMVLLQIASEKMLNLERTIEKHRDTIPGNVFEELKDCVTQEAALLPPPSRGYQRQQQQQQQQPQQHSNSSNNSKRCCLTRASEWWIHHHVAASGNEAEQQQQQPGQGGIDKITALVKVHTP
ncbi:unnamed protein product, partial [Pylaiella littoralis]